jgi:hypothetical protein
MIAALLLAAVTALPTGRLCVDRTPCVATTGASAQITPSAAQRRFVWTADDGNIVAVGSIDANAKFIAVAEGTSRPLRIVTRDTAPIAFELFSPDARWQWTISKPPPSLRLIHPPCETCRLKATAEGFRPFEKQLRDIVEVAMHPWPRVTGTVIDRATNAPLAGATITAAGKLLTKTERNGAFAASIEKAWPSAVDVDYPGRASRHIELPRWPRDTELPAIELSTGGALRVMLDPPIPQKLTWTLDDRREGSIEPSATIVSVDEIGEGKHTFTISGERPLQRFALPVEITDGAVKEATIAIEPAVLHIQVTHGSDALADASIDVKRPDDSWKATVVLDHDGQTTEELWQRGTLYSAIDIGARNVYVADTKVESDEADWQIVVPNRSVTGRVVDATTGVPLADARVNFRILEADSKTVIGQLTDAEGRFVFGGVAEGTHELEAMRDGYNRVENIPVVVGNADGTYEHDLRLRSRKEGRPLAVTDEQGLPIPDALVMLANVEGVREVAWTGLDGRCTVPMRPADSGMLLVIPRSGSFGLLRVAPRGDEGEALALRVRPAAAAIDVHARDDAGKPMANVLIVPRVDGWLLPTDLMDALVRVQGASFLTDANGRARLEGLPRGVYELWTVTSRDEMRAVRSQSPPAPTASLEVVSGRYAVTVGFAAQ